MKIFEVTRYFNCVTNKQTGEIVNEIELDFKPSGYLDFDEDGNEGLSVDYYTLEEWEYLNNT